MTMYFDEICRMVGIEKPVADGQGTADSEGGMTEPRLKWMPECVWLDPVVRLNGDDGGWWYFLQSNRDEVPYVAESRLREVETERDALKSALLACEKFIAGDRAAGEPYQTLGQYRVALLLQIDAALGRSKE